MVQAVFSILQRASPPHHQHPSARCGEASESVFVKAQRESVYTGLWDACATHLRWKAASRGFLCRPAQLWMNQTCRPGATPSVILRDENESLSLTYYDKGGGTGCSVWTRPINLYQPRALTRSINPDADSAALQGADLSRHSSEFRSMAANNEDERAPLELFHVLACSLIYILARVSIFIPSSLKPVWISSKTVIKSITLISVFLCSITPLGPTQALDCSNS